MKALAAALFLSLAVTTGVFAFGIGAQANFSAGDIFAPGAALLISPSNITHIAINWYLNRNDVNIIGLTLDLVPLNLPLKKFSSGSFNLTLGVGLFANVVFTSQKGFNGGLRIPVGFNITLGQNRAFEIFTHVAPSFGVHFLPSLGFSRPFFPIALGARLWFR